MVSRSSSLRLGFVFAMATAVAAAIAEPPKPDAGKFALLLQGKSIGSDTFRLLPDGCDSDASVSISGQELQFRQILKYRKGQWTQLSTNAGPLGVMTVTLAGEKSSLKVGDKPAVTQKLPETAYPYGDRSPHLFAFLVAAYDVKKGGEQKFNLIYTEGLSPTKGILTLTATVKEPESSVRENAGKPLSVVRYPLTLTGTAGPIAMEVLTDKDRHVLVWSVPAQRYMAVREGFRDLAR